MDGPMKKALGPLKAAYDKMDDEQKAQFRDKLEAATGEGTGAAASSTATEPKIRPKSLIFIGLLTVLVVIVFAVLLIL